MARLWRFTVSLDKSKQPIASDPHNMDKIKHYPCQWEYIKYSIMYWLIPVIILTIWLGQQLQSDHHLIKFMMVYSEPPRSIPLLHEPNRQVKRVCITYHPPCIFKILDSSTNFCNSSKVVMLLLVYLLSSFSWAIVMSWIPRNYCQFRANVNCQFRANSHKFWAITCSSIQAFYKCLPAPLKKSWKNIIGYTCCNHAGFYSKRDQSPL